MTRRGCLAKHGRLEDAIPHAGKDFAGGDNPAGLQDRIDGLTEELEGVRGGSGFAGAFARKFVSVNL